MSEDKILGKIQQYLRGISYPANKNNVLTKIGENGIPDELIIYLLKLPDITFESQEELVSEIAKSL